MKQLTDEVFAQVREALEIANANNRRNQWSTLLTDAALAALDTAQPEPVNAMLVEALKDTMYSLQAPPVSCQQGVVSKCKCRTCAVARGDTALTAAQQAQPERAPLTQEQIENLCVEVHLKRDFNTNLEKFVAIARAIEAAHGIKQGGQQ